MYSQTMQELCLRKKKSLHTARNIAQSRVPSVSQGVFSLTCTIQVSQARFRKVFVYLIATESSSLKASLAWI